METGSGRESKESSDLFFLCGLIAYIARKTLNHPRAVVAALGRERLRHIYELADVYHCENLDKLSDELIEKSGLAGGNFDNTGTCQYTIPSHWDIGKVYKRLILDVSKDKGGDLIDALMEVYRSWISGKIEDYNSSAYYESPAYLFASYREGEMIKE
jgi:hypothetical protein